ncbi:MAG: hypothetical protein ACM3S4_12395 [Burkholderiales bacterium]
MYVNFDMSISSAEQMFTLVYKKADGAYEYFYANADAEGCVQFGPIHELSTTLLAKGLLPNEPMSVEEMNTQAGVFEMYILGINVWWFIGIGTALVVDTGVVVVVVLRIRKRGTDKRAA